MATIIPSRLPATASQGERNVHQLLARLPEDCVIYYEPNINGRHPDFVVIIPRLGVLVIEVKGWYAKHLRQIDADTVLLDRDGIETREKHPEKQVREYLFALMGIARKHVWSQSLLHRDGSYEGRFRFPFAPLVVLSNISESSLTDNEIDAYNWDRLFPGDRTVRRDQLDLFSTLAGEALVEALRPFIQPSWPFPKLGEEEVKALRAVIHPEILLGDKVSIDRLLRSGRVLDDQQDVVQILDLQQEEHAQALGDGHRIVYGVAGSGKTVLLLARAKRLAETRSGRILVTCYNRILAVWMAAQLRDFPRVTVMNFHAIASECGFKFVWGRDRDGEEWGTRFLAFLGEEPGGNDKYDAILVDEAQDFEPSWFRCLLASMNDPEDGDLLIVADGCQSLYGRSKVSWSQLGIKARGRTISGNFQLDRNYRNSREIIALAESFACSTGEPDDLDAIQSVRVNMSHCERSTGASPTLIECRSREDELLEVERLIAQLLDGTWDGRRVGKLAAHEIAILYPRASGGEKQLLRAFTKHLNETVPAVWLSSGSSSRNRAGDDALKIQTIHSAKGLQYRAVIIMWADKMPRVKEPRDEYITERRLLYVAMTRAISFLAMTASGRSSFVDEIADVPGIVSVPVVEAKPEAEAIIH
jgi:hypothetical protein